MRVWRDPLAFGVAALALAACKDGTGPGGDQAIVAINVGDPRTL